jgi:hypothetical protein
MAKHGGTDHNKGELHRGTKRQPNPRHAGSGLPHGRTHEAPTRPAVNSANYAGQKVKRK